MLRFILTLLLLAAMGPASAVILKACNTNAECSEDECCLQMPWTVKFFCFKRVREGHVCWNAPHSATATNDRYRVICPCITNYECKFQNTFFPLKPVFAVSTCQPLDKNRDTYVRDYENRERTEEETRKRLGEGNRERLGEENRERLVEENQG